MATPRMFISSTCYDLQEIRFQLRRFIEEVGYEPVMSDFGDIFYDLSQHVQDACKEEINKCNIFILVVGNNYGSIYHKHNESNSIPDSITLQEFRKALEVGVPKYIFINRFVQYDFENYRRALSKYLAQYFAENDVENKEVEHVKSKLKRQFDRTYPFPQDAYQYVFYFLDEIYNLDVNNAVFSFESFENIKESLKKQWAGFFYEALTKEQNVPLGRISIVEKKLDKIESQLRLLVEGVKTNSENNTISIDISSITKDIDIGKLVEIQERIDNILDSLVTQLDYNLNEYVAIKFREILDNDSISKWLDHLGKIVKEYKWSKSIPSEVVFSVLKYDFIDSPYTLSHQQLLEFYSIYNGLGEDDKIALHKTIYTKFNKLYEPNGFPEPPPFNSGNGEDVPF